MNTSICRNCIFNSIYIFRIYMFIVTLITKSYSKRTLMLIKKPLPTSYIFGLVPLSHTHTHTLRPFCVAILELWETHFPHTAPKPTPKCTCTQSHRKQLVNDKKKCWAVLSGLSLTVSITCVIVTIFLLHILITNSLLLHINMKLPDVSETASNHKAVISKLDDPLVHFLHTALIV